MNYHNLIKVGENFLAKTDLKMINNMNLFYYSQKLITLISIVILKMKKK